MLFLNGKPMGGAGTLKTQTYNPRRRAWQHIRADVKFFETAFENSHLITAYRADTTHKYPERVTATFNLFKYIDEAIVFICGPEKQAKFKELLAGQAQINHLPIAGVVKTKHYQIFTNIQ
jgi:6-phosphogluconolactonase/glucosamine-6-phosphate isomerase/deaminase